MMELRYRLFVPEDRLLAKVTRRRSETTELRYLSDRIRDTFTTKIQSANILCGPVQLCVDVYVGRPKSHTDASGKLRKTAPTHPTDLVDMGLIVRSIMKSLTGIVWERPCQVVSIESDKRFTQNSQGIDIAIYEVTEAKDV